MYLLDTDHCSRLIGNDPSIVKKLSELGDAFIATCAIVSGELIFMAHKSEYVDQNLQQVSALLRDIEVLPVDDEAARVYGRLKAAILDKFGPREKAKRRRFGIDELGFKDNDLWIAAVAKRDGLVVVSADGDFQRLRQVLDVAVEQWCRPDTDVPPTD